MTTICLIRHGETPWNREGRFQGRLDVPLNDRGRRQAQETAEAVKNREWDVIFSSPLSRAYQTAEIIAQAVGIEQIQMCAEFVERDLGVASGHPYVEMDAKYPDGAFPGLETLGNLQQRVMRGFEKTVASHPGKRIIIVGHAYSLNAILYTLTKGQYGAGDIPRIPHGYAATLHSEGDQWVVDEFRER